MALLTCNLCARFREDEFKVPADSMGEELMREHLREEHDIVV